MKKIAILAMAAALCSCESLNTVTEMANKVNDTAAAVQGATNTVNQTADDVRATRDNLKNKNQY